MTQPETLDTLLAEMSGPPPEEVLAGAARRFSGRIAFASSLGLEDQVITAMIAEAGLDIPIFTLDTGRLFPEAYDLIDRTTKRYGLSIQPVLPRRGRGRRDGRPRWRQPVPRQHRAAQAVLRRAQGACRCGARRSSSTPGSAACAAARARRARPSSRPSGTPAPTWSRSTPWPRGTRTRSGSTSAPTTCRTTRCTTRASPASAARRARAPWRPARTPLGALVVGERRAPRVRPAPARRHGGGRATSPVGSRPRRALLMNQLDTLEAKSVHILREAYRSLGNVCMLWSIGKDSTVMLHLARKAFFGHVPIPLVHVDTAYKMPEMIEYRDRLALRVAPQHGRRPEPQGARRQGTPSPTATSTASPAAATSRRWRSSTRSRANGRACAWTTPPAASWRTRTASPTPASSSACAPTRRARAPRSATSRRATSRTTGTSTTSRPSCGATSRPTSSPARTCACTRCSTGPSSTSGNTSSARASP